MGVHLDPRVLIQHDHRQIERLIVLKHPDGGIVHNGVVVNLGPPTHPLPFQIISRPTLTARCHRRVLEPVTSRAILDDQPLLVGGLPEGLSQIIGYHTLLYHIFSPMLEDSRAAFAVFTVFTVFNVSISTWSTIFTFGEYVKRSGPRTYANSSVLRKKSRTTLMYREVSSQWGMWALFS